MSDPPTAAAAVAAPWLERDVWLACAGPFAFLPSVNTQVYYYPRGHADLQCRGINVYLPPDDTIPCTVSSVQLGYHAHSDDPYALITLQPDPEQGPAAAQPAAAAAAPEHHQPTGTKYYVKQLTGQKMDKSPFTVPKPCADSLFPLLEGDASQDLPMLDVHGKTYRFKRSVKKNRSNILTAKWNGYFEEKKLQLYKDSVVFIRRADAQLLIGSRRGGGPSIDRAPSDHLKVELSPLVREVAERALRRDQFTVTYYPRQGWPFVVPRKQVDDALQLHWRQGMNVRMTAVDDHELDSSRRDARTPASYIGLVSSVKNDTWCKLQVNWEEPPQGKHENWQGPTIPNRDVNIWQVEAMED